MVLAMVLFYQEVLFCSAIVAVPVKQCYGAVPVKLCYGAVPVKLCYGAVLVK